MVDADKLPLGVGRIAGQKIKVRIFQGDQPSLRIQVFNSHSHPDGEGRFFCENCRAGVSLFQSVVPKRIVSGRGKGDLPLLELCLLEAEKVGIRFIEKIRKALTHTGTQAIDIPGNAFHLVSSVSDAVGNGSS